MHTQAYFFRKIFRPELPCMYTDVLGIVVAHLPGKQMIQVFNHLSFHPNFNTVALEKKQKNYVQSIHHTGREQENPTRSGSSKTMCQPHCV